MVFHGIQNSESKFLALADRPARIASTGLRILEGGRLKSRGQLPRDEMAVRNRNLFTPMAWSNEKNCRTGMDEAEPPITCP